MIRSTQRRSATTRSASTPPTSGVGDRTESARSARQLWLLVPGELGLGARIGVVHMRSEALQNSQFTAHRFARLWLGPTAAAALGIDLTRTVAVRACFGLGVVATGATARDLGEPVATVDGTLDRVACSAGSKISDSPSKSARRRLGFLSSVSAAATRAGRRLTVPCGHGHCSAN